MEIHDQLLNDILFSKQGFSGFQALFLPFFLL